MRFLSIVAQHRPSRRSSTANRYTIHPRWCIVRHCNRFYWTDARSVRRSKPREESLSVKKTRCSYSSSRSDASFDHASEIVQFHLTGVTEIEFTRTGMLSKRSFQHLQRIDVQAFFDLNAYRPLKILSRRENRSLTHRKVLVFLDFYGLKSNK